MNQSVPEIINEIVYDTPEELSEGKLTYKVKLPSLEGDRNIRVNNTDISTESIYHFMLNESRLLKSEDDYFLNIKYISIRNLMLIEFNEETSKLLDPSNYNNDDFVRSAFLKYLEKRRKAVEQLIIMCNFGRKNRRIRLSDKNAFLMVLYLRMEHNFNELFY